MKRSQTRVCFSGLAAAMLLSASAAAIEPELNNCTLQVGKDILKPTAVLVPWKMSESVGNFMGLRVAWLSRLAGSPRRRATNRRFGLISGPLHLRPSYLPLRHCCDLSGGCLQRFITVSDAGLRLRLQ